MNVLHFFCLFRQFLFSKIFHVSIRDIYIIRDLLEDKKGIFEMGIQEINFSTKVETKETKKEKKAAEKAKEIARQAEAEALVRGLAGQEDAIKRKDIRNNVKDKLQELYQNGQIDKETYKDAKKYAGLGNIFQRAGRFFTGKQKESTIVYDGIANNNNVENVKKNGGPKYDAELQQKLDKANVKTSDIYYIIDQYVGSENTVTYSNKNVQAGEIRFILRDLNFNDKGVTFTEKEAKEICKGAGYNIEKTVDAGKAIAGGALGSAATVVPFTPFIGATVSQHQQNNVNGVTQNEQFQSAPRYQGVLPTAAATGFVFGTLDSIDRQRKRVEDKAIPVGMPAYVKTFDDYAKNLDHVATPYGAEIGKKIASYYTKEDGTLLKDQLIADLKQAGGSVGQEDASVVNHKEALVLLAKLESGQIKVQKDEPKPQPEPVKETCEIQTGKETITETTAAPTDCYTVKSGDNWFEVAKAKYGATDAEASKIARKLKEAYYEAHKEELNKKGINSSKGAFFPKVGDELCVPSEIEITDNKGNVKSFNYNESAAVKSGEIDKEGKYKWATVNGGANFTTETEKDVYTAVTCDGERMEASSKEGLQAKIDEYKKANPDKEVIVK